MLIEKYDVNPKFEIGFSPFYFVSYPLYNIQCRSILYKYLNNYDKNVTYSPLVNINNLNIKTYVICIFNSLHQIYYDEGISGLYRGLIPMLAHIISKKSIYYLLEKIHFVIRSRRGREKQRGPYNSGKTSRSYEHRFVDDDSREDDRENAINFIGDEINCQVVRQMDMVRDDDDSVKKKKKKKYFHLSFYHSFYEYLSCILSYPLLNISTKLIVFQNNSVSLMNNLKAIVHLTYVYDGVKGFFKGLNSYLLIQSMEKILNCFLYRAFSDNCSYEKVLTIKVVLSTCLNTIIAPYIQYSILSRSQSLVPGLCKDTTFNHFFYNFHWKSHLSNVSVGLVVAGVQLIIIALLPRDPPKTDEVVDQEKDEYF
ncbi:conserved Plasmodium protein, unknown function [Plasmodium knowlesi strain H]|uniref:Mitochondrial carrier protein n=3 Tax=Plasmodium knowlesi TaxID=5850 RepID=A0A5K1U3R7_PLAKH|nr:mitochondrial carrier protein, putative [Plasmodium knowlesi strain H]OTN66169.1 Uncharacterized protein PKNOH_S09514200 [Plasmodium knowlesi]CAA9986315.1 mitochondrial carrier protein, putative [Plasmodium knowlesi strain H]SBO25551.1 conserved Plasmodium protein, unknown function [Plasmodium knowlesi strain H]SBO28299.1 conserved Plasmodium protein, unknown function [Plasmodium knowlesi strain H]VVS75789.1 mitochondrial carrier protein, putative [Plasmodium knowlesi strain H]|eukprot:XP_002257720.1 hypothetical protein, conserved in Plasmodium species [Plasmodium knowlesi strain H]